MSWTTPEDIKDLYNGRAVLPTDQKLQRYIDYVEAQIINEYGDLIQGWIDTSKVSLSYLTATVSFIIIEFLSTEGKPYQSESQSYANAGSKSVSMRSDARYSLDLTADDYAKFRPRNNDAVAVVSMAPNARRFPIYDGYYGGDWVDDKYPGSNTSGWSRIR